jgi:hypothetical protein
MRLVTFLEQLATDSGTSRVDTESGQELYQMQGTSDIRVSKRRKRQ